MKKDRGSVEALKKITALGNKIHVKEMAAIGKMAESFDGQLVAVEAHDDDWCGTGRIILPWPPKPDRRLVKFFDELVNRRINFEVLINGIPVPREVIINVSRQVGHFHAMYN